MSEDKITLQECIDITNKFIKGEIDQNEFAQFGGKMTIRSYLPLQEKIGSVMIVLTRYQYGDFDGQEMKIAELYKNIFFFIVLQQYAMIDCSDVSLQTFENYDLLYPVFMPFIMSFSKEDYEMVNNMLHDSINVYNIENLLDGFDTLDYDALSKATAENKKLINKLEKNKKTIEDLKYIMNANDPMVAKIADELKTIAIKLVMEKEEKL